MTTFRKTYIPSAESIMMFRSIDNDGNYPHNHEFIELVYVASGQGLHHIRGKTYRISAGDLFIICTPDEHVLQPLPGEADSFQWLNCIFLPEFTDFDLSIFPPENRYIGTEGFEMMHLFEAMMREYAAKKPGYLEALAAYLKIVLIGLSRLLDAGGETSDRYSLRRRKADLKKAVAYVRRHYQEEVRLEAIAAFLGVSASYVGKLFKELQGESPIAYLNQYRLELSCRMLLESPQLSISRVSAECGFKDPKFYYALFKRKTGMTPGQWRDKYGH